MKTYKITANLFHESFGGYTHFDGKQVYLILAGSKKSAENKVHKKIHKERGGWGAIIAAEQK
jgi:hypothetical protein